LGRQSNEGTELHNTEGNANKQRPYPENKHDLEFWHSEFKGTGIRICSSVLGEDSWTQAKYM
jgi:hypothetical protein